MSSIGYNDMPGEYREKLKLMDLLHRILRTNGIVDLEAVTNDLANLKTQLNSLLSEVLGVEHEIDNIHNYDDTSLKNDVNNIKTQIQTAFTNITYLQGQLTGITSSTSELDIKNDALIDISTMDDNKVGSRVFLTKNQVALQSIDKVNGNNKIHGQIAVGGPNDTSGIDISSDFNIVIANRYLQHYIRVKEDVVEISDVNGVQIAADSDGITFTKLLGPDLQKHVTIPWAGSSAPPPVNAGNPSGGDGQDEYEDPVSPGPGKNHDDDVVNPGH
jgi:hypothetical protein